MRLAISMIVTGILMGGCAKTPLTYTVAAPAPVASEDSSDPCSDTLCAGVRRVDITPPPNVPLGGYGPDSAARNEGYTSRLYAQIIVLQDSDGRRVALTSLDIPHGSALLHHAVAERTAKLGLSVGQIVLSATHTHSGPGNLHSASFYNTWGSGGFRWGIDETHINWMADEIAKGIAESVNAMQPAKLASGTAILKHLSHNRSLEAWRKNVSPIAPPFEDRITFLRIDHQSAASSPMAVYAVASVHSTVIPNTTTMLDSDLHGAFSRALRSTIEEQCEQEEKSCPIVVAVVNGAEGDQSVVRLGQKPYQVIARQSGRFADAVGVEWARLEGELTADVSITASLNWANPSRAYTSEGTLCIYPSVGIAVVGGDESGRGPVKNVEGKPREFARNMDHCRGDMRIFASQTFQWMTDIKRRFPNEVPFHVIQIGDELVLATVPGEPSTTLGRDIEAVITDVVLRDQATKTQLGGGVGPTHPALVRVVGLTNHYTGYFSTNDEYQAQHYEGGSNPWGQWQGMWATEQLINAAESGHHLLGHTKTFRPTRRRTCWLQNAISTNSQIMKEKCSPGDDSTSPSEWEPIGGACSTNKGLTTCRFAWTGQDLLGGYRTPALAKIRCGDSVEIDDNDHSIAVKFENSKKKPNHWELVWTVPELVSSTAGCMAVISLPDGELTIEQTAP